MLLKITAGVASCRCYQKQVAADTDCRRSGGSRYTRLLHSFDAAESWPLYIE